MTSGMRKRRFLMTKKIYEIAAEIVQAQASVGKMTPEEIEVILLKTFGMLQKMRSAEEEGTLLLQGGRAEDVQGESRPLEKISPKDSIQENKVICLECGVEMRQLTTKHLTSHGLNPRDYKKKWGFPLKQSLSARSLSRARSRAAKKRGLPENLVKFQEERKLKKGQSGVPAAGRPEEPKKA